MRLLKGSSLALSLSLALSVALSAPAAEADEIYTFVVKKQEKKKNTRWSLQDWLDTRDRMRLMDLWLAIHSPSPYEFYLSGAYVSAENPASGRSTGWNASVAAFASIAGLEVQHQSVGDTDVYRGLIHLRVFGMHAQGTNITLQAGLSSQETAGTGAVRNAVAGISTTLYLMRYLGVEGLYRHAFDSVPNRMNLDLGGRRLEGGAFIDFRFLRVFGSYYQQTYRELPDADSGLILGTRLFF